MQLLDMAGLDIYTSVGSYLNPDLSQRAPRSRRRSATCVEGTSSASRPRAGLFDYTPEQIAELRAQRARKLDGRPQGARVMRRYVKI